jgi:hypothetical protein
MQALGNKLLARPTLADHQHWPVKRCRTAGSLDSIQKCGGLTNELNIISIHFQILAYFTIEWQ